MHAKREGYPRPAPVSLARTSVTMTGMSCIFTACFSVRWNPFRRINVAASTASNWWRFCGTRARARALADGASAGGRDTQGGRRTLSSDELVELADIEDGPAPLLLAPPP